MSLHLKSRRACPPSGFIFRQNQTGWELQNWDFEQLCMELQKHRLANPSLKLPTDLDSIREEVDVTNANRVAAIPNADSYVVGSTTPPKTLASRLLFLLLSVSIADSRALSEDLVRSCSLSEIVAISLSHPPY